MAKANLKYEKPTVVLELTYKEACVVRSLTGSVLFDQPGELDAVTGAIYDALNDIDAEPGSVSAAGIKFDRVPWK